MQTSRLLTLAACVTLIGSPFTKIAAETSVPSPSPSPTIAPAKAPAKNADAKPMDPEQAKMNDARKKAMQDPDVKASMDEARKVQMEANKKLLEKIREIDPSLGPAVDKQEEKMKPQEKPDKPATAATSPSPKPEKPASPAKSPSPKPAKKKTDSEKSGDQDKPVINDKKGDKKPVVKPADQ